MNITRAKKILDHICISLITMIPNAYSKVYAFEKDPEDQDPIAHLVFFTSRDLDQGEEVLYDYGERRKHIINDGNQFLVET